VQGLIWGRHVEVNGHVVWLSSWKVANGDRVELNMQPAPKPTPPAAFVDEWLIVLDEDLIVVDKPAGLLSEPSRNEQATNLRDLARARFGRVTLFHRLDRDTSGVLVLTRTDAGNRWLDELFRQRLVRKEYRAVVRAPNGLAATGTMHDRVGPDPRRRDRMAVVARGGQHAITSYEVIAARPDRAWVRLWPETGRTHQLRVQLAALDAPILGDRLYGDPAAADRLMLHAHVLSLPSHPPYPSYEFTAPLPPGFAP
jgi:RluA family pseudouridine synthase